MFVFPTNTFPETNNKNTWKWMIGRRWNFILGPGANWQVLHFWWKNSCTTWHVKNLKLPTLNWWMPDFWLPSTNVWHVISGRVKIWDGAQVWCGGDCQGINSHGSSAPPEPWPNSLTIRPSTPPTYPPPRNLGLIAGLIKGNQWLYKLSRRPYFQGGYVLGRIDWLAMIRVESVLEVVGIQHLNK